MVRDLGRARPPGRRRQRGHVSHEFRTPLTLIAAPVEDALSDDLHPLPAEQRGRLEAVQRNARRLRRLVNDMLDFARIEGGRLQAERIPIDLSRFTADVALSFAPAIERAGLQLSLDVARLDRQVFIDPDMWEKIVLNLLSNALKFTLEGGIRLTLSGDADELCLSVADSGVGIAAAHLPHLFERFYRAPRPAARSHEGTGIGLALVAELARLHGGDVSAESGEGRGSVFTVRVPYGAPSASSGQQRESSLVAYLDEAMQWTGEGTESDGYPLTLDLNRVTYIDSAGVSALFGRARRGGLEIVAGPDSVVAPLIRITRLDEVATVTPS